MNSIKINGIDHSYELRTQSVRNFEKRHNANLLRVDLSKSELTFSDICDFIEEVCPSADLSEVSPNDVSKIFAAILSGESLAVSTPVISPPKPSDMASASPSGASYAPQSTIQLHPQRETLSPTILAALPQEDIESLRDFDF